MFFNKYFFIARSKPGSLLGAGSRMVMKTQILYLRSRMLHGRQTKWLRDYSTTLLVVIEVGTGGCCYSVWVLHSFSWGWESLLKETTSGLISQ